MKINYEKIKISKLSRNLYVINFNTDNELIVNIVHVGPNWKDIESWLTDHNCTAEHQTDFVSRWLFPNVEVKDQFITDWT
jgi:hypothetical protein